MKRGVSIPIDSSFDSLLGDFNVFPSASAKTSSQSFMDDLLASPVSAQPRSDMDEIDALGLNQDGAAGSVAVIAVTSGSSETKPDQSLPTVFDNLGLMELATSSAASSAVQPRKDSAGLDDMLDLSLNLSSQSSHVDASGREQEDTLNVPEHNTMGSQNQLMIRGESFLDGGSVANVPTIPAEKEREESTALGFSDGSTNDLGWGFGTFEKAPVSQSASSDFSLLDDFGLSNNSSSKPALGSAASQGQLLDLMDDFGFGTPSASSNMKSSLKHSMSLPDILAMENDAIQGDLLETQSTVDILKSHDIPMFPGRKTSVVQVNFDLQTPKIGSKLAPAPPPAPVPSAPAPTGPQMRSVAKTLFGRLKKKTVRNDIISLFFPHHPPKLLSLCWW